MSKYGEPWTIFHGSDYFEVNDDYDACIYSDEIQLERSVACVNALAGVENPEAVKELLDAIKRWMTVPNDGNKKAVLAELDVMISAILIKFTEEQP